MMSNLEKRKVFSKYIETVDSTKFSEYLETLEGYSLTFFVVPDEIWGRSRPRAPTCACSCSSTTRRTTCTKAESDRLPAGAKVWAPCSLSFTFVFMLCSQGLPPGVETEDMLDRLLAFRELVPFSNCTVHSCGGTCYGYCFTWFLNSDIHPCTWNLALCLAAACFDDDQMAIFRVAWGVGGAPPTGTELPLSRQPSMTDLNKSRGNWIVHVCGAGW